MHSSCLYLLVRTWVSAWSSTLWPTRSWGPRLGFCHSFFGQASSRWCLLPGKPNSGQFFPANNYPAQSSTVALTGGWSVQGSKRIIWFRMSMLGPALCASAENSSWDIVILIHAHPSCACLRAFVCAALSAHNASIANCLLCVIQIWPRCLLHRGIFLPDLLNIHPFSLSLPYFFSSSALIHAGNAHSRISSLSASTYPPNRTKPLEASRSVLITTVPIMPGTGHSGASKRSNQSILKEINPEYSLEGLVLKLKHQYFDHLMRRADLLEKTLMLGKIEGRRRRGQQRMRWLDGIIDWMDMSFSKLREIVKDRKAWHATIHGVRHNWETEQ